MSAIFGLIRLDGQPVRAEHLARLGEALAGYGPDGGGIWRNGAAGLGQRLLASTAEAAYERMPLASPDGRLAFTAAGRLDNRAELLAALGAPAAGQEQVADSAIMLRAYERWGEGCAERLLGDWAFAAWHPAEGRLVLARDQLGITGLHYYLGEGLVAFASGLPALLALPFVPRRLNELQLARLLAVLPGDGFDTMYQGIARLPPAHTLVAQNGAVRVRRYWRLEDAPEIRLASDAAYVEGFLHHFGAAVEARLRAVRPVGATLSAGLDSSSVTALAARALRARGAPLTAFTARPGFPAEHLVGRRGLADEWPYAQRTAALAGVAEHIAVPAASFSPSAALAWAQQTFAEPQHAAGNMHWLHELLAQARQRGIGVLLTGQLGNGGISWAGDAYRGFNLLRAGRPEALRALAEYQVASGRSWAGTLKRQLLSPLYKSLRLAARQLDPRPPWRGYAPLNERFARRIGLAELAHAAPHEALARRPGDERQMRLLLLRPLSNPAGALWQAQGAAFGLEVRDPTADIRLLSFCLGLPADQSRRGDQARLLIRRAMVGLLPDEVLSAAWVGRQAADIGQRLLADRAAIEELLGRMERSAACAEYLDLAGLRHSWAELQRSLTPATNLRAMTFLSRGLSAGLFLLTLG